MRSQRARERVEIDFAFEDFSCGASHAHARRIARPLEFERAARKLRMQRARAFAQQHASNAHRARARAAREGDARAALPCAHHGFARIRPVLHEVHIDARGEPRVALEVRANRFERNLPRIIARENHMRITHRHQRDMRLNPGRVPPTRCAKSREIDLVRDHARVGGNALDARRNTRMLKDRRAHHDACAGNAAVGSALPQNFQHATTGLDPQRICRHHATIDRVFRHAADAVAAHLAFAGVGVKHAHAQVGIGTRRRAHGDEPVTANREMPVAHDPRHAREIERRVLRSIDVNVVVADAMHLCELHGASVSGQSGKKPRASSTPMTAAAIQRIATTKRSMDIASQSLPVSVRK